MAKNYNDIYTTVYTKGNKMDFGNSMIRGNGIPLDITAVYNSLSAAEAYVNSNPVAYEGQVLAVTENNDTVVYVIAARLGSDGVTVEHYLKEVGSAPAVDGITIKIVDGKLTAVIPEYEDTDTKYTLSVLADGKISFISDADGAVATEVSFVGAQGIAVTSNAETGIITFTGPDLSGLATKTELADKANSADVYTKTETDTKIGEAIAAADHLKRVILDPPSGEETVEDVINEWLGNNENAIADEYIYMIPSGLEADDNKYYEYIIIVDGENSYVEQVGNWEVDLSDYLKSTDAESTYAKKTDLASYAKSEEVANTYVKQTDLETTLDDYSTSEEIANAYVSKDGLTTTLADYAKTIDIPTDYVSDSEFETAMTEYDKSSVADGKYAPKQDTADSLANRYTKEEVNSLLANKVSVVDGKSLIDDTEIERLATVNEKAEENYINSINEEVFTVEDKKLNLKEIPQALVGNLTKTSWVVETITDSEGKEVNNFVASTAPALLADILKPATYDSVTKTGTSGLMTAEQVQKLQALVIGDEGVEISGTVNADNVTGLGAWITTNRDTIEGLYPVVAKNLLKTLDNTTKEHGNRLDALEYAMIWHDIETNESV